MQLICCGVDTISNLCIRNIYEPIHDVEKLFQLFYQGFISVIYSNKICDFILKRKNNDKVVLGVFVHVAGLHV